MHAREGLGASEVQGKLGNVFGMGSREGQGMVQTREGGMRIQDMVSTTREPGQVMHAREGTNVVQNPGNLGKLGNVFGIGSREGQGMVRMRNGEGVFCGIGHIPRESCQVMHVQLGTSWVQNPGNQGDAVGIDSREVQGARPVRIR